MVVKKMQKEKKTACVFKMLEFKGEKKKYLHNGSLDGGQSDP